MRACACVEVSEARRAEGHGMGHGCVVAGRWARLGRGVVCVCACKCVCVCDINVNHQALSSSIMPFIMHPRPVQLACLGAGNKDLEDGLRWLEGNFRDKARGWVSGACARAVYRLI